MLQLRTFVHLQNEPDFGESSTDYAENRPGEAARQNDQHPDSPTIRNETEVLVGILKAMPIEQQ